MIDRAGSSANNVVGDVIQRMTSDPFQPYSFAIFFKSFMDGRILINPAPPGERSKMNRGYNVCRSGRPHPGRSA